ncbi:MAG TPA: response regulator [Bryobacteraceae bacterium]|jgi:DNA-binding NarL/FixJ family response regulator
MTTVLIATTEPVLAKGLETILVAGEIEIAGICTDITELMDQFNRAAPDVAILDAPVLPALDVIAELRRLWPKTQLVMWPRQLSAEQASEAVRLGARGVLPPNAPPARLVEAVNLLAGFPAAAAAPGAQVGSTCSAAELQAVALVGHGMNNQEIAAVMHFDEAAVDKLLKSVSQRLGAQDRCELALYGLSAINQLQPEQEERQEWKNEIAIA